MKTDYVRLDHGSGGETSHELVKDVILSRLDNEFLHKLDDSAVVSLPRCKLAMTTDSYVVDPIFFPGGNIGSLAVHGTVNDLSMQGATPLYLTLGLMLEEGLPMKKLLEIVDAIGEASKEAGVKIISGDTKVVPKGHMDKIFINTSGIGLIPDGVDVGIENANPGDVVIINGNLGDHGLAVLTQREGLDLKTKIMSDSAPLNSLVSSILEATKEVHVLRDPTRGGIATALNEIASHSQISIMLREELLPVQKRVHSACEILGLDPLYVANEGKCIVIVPGGISETVLSAMKENKHGKNSCMIGEITSGDPGKVFLKTKIGGTRILSMLTGEQLPRIC